MDNVARKPMASTRTGRECCVKTLVLEVVPGGNQIDDACGTEQKSSRTGQLHSKRMQKVSAAAVACLLKAIFNSIRERVLSRTYV